MESVNRGKQASTPRILSQFLDRVEAITAQIARDLDRDYEAVLDFVHEVQETSGEIGEFELSEVCEADEVYVTTGEKGREDEDSSPRERGLKKGTRRLRGRQTTSPDTRPSV